VDEKTKSSIFSRVIIILLIGLVLFLSNKENQSKFVNYINSLTTAGKSLQVAKFLSIDGPIEKVAYRNNKILVWGSNKLTLYDLNGSKDWEKEFSLNNPNVLFGKERVYVYDSTLGDIYCLSFSGDTLERIQIGTGIKSITENGERLIVHTIEQNNEGLKILDFNGNIVDNRSVESKILTYSIDEDNKAYGICTLNLAGDSIKTQVQVYEIKRDLVSSLSLENEISLYVKLIGKNKLLVLTDKGLHLIEGDVVLWKKELENIKDIYVDENNNINILNDNTFQIISKNGDIKDKYSFTQDYDRIIPLNNYTVLWESGYIVGLQEGKEVFKYQPKDEIYDVVEGEKHLIVVYQNRIDLLSY